MRLLFALCAILIFQSSLAQEQQSQQAATLPAESSLPCRFYPGNGLDLMMLSTAIVAKPGLPARVTPPRFTAVVNFGFTFNCDLSDRFGLLTGVGLRNMGFTETAGDLTIKRRVYALGLPLGLKLGNLRKRNFLFFGAGADFPFHYKEKRFFERGEKEKLNEWFSERTPRVMPFVFAGQSFNPGITLKLQYYPMNFMNEDFETEAGQVQPHQPFSGYKVNLLLLSLGIDIHYKQYKIQEREYQQMKQKKQQTAGKN